MENYWIWIYFGIVNLLSAVLFYIDKRQARKNQRRIPEQILHFVEILGGVFSSFILMYVLRHKNRKPGYFMWTWLILIWWVIIFVISTVDFSSFNFFMKKH